MIHRSAIFVALLASLTWSVPAAAHCDTTQGPVVTAARAALDKGDPNLVLHWVRPEDETSVRTVFEQVMEVRGEGPEASALADRYFFETLVRIHRAGEGAPYMGLTDGEPEPIVLATDQALESGSADALEGRLVAVVKEGLKERFTAARSAKGFRPGDVAAGRDFVAEYVPLTHWVEGVFNAAKGTAEHHAAGGPHGEAVHDGAHAVADGHTEGKTHDSTLHRLLPWLLTAVLGVTATVEGAFLLRRRH